MISSEYKHQLRELTAVSTSLKKTIPSKSAKRAVTFFESDQSSEDEKPEENKKSKRNKSINTDLEFNAVPLSIRKKISTTKALTYSETDPKSESNEMKTGEVKTRKSKRSK